MDQDTILDILGSGGSELEALKENLDHLTGFLTLLETVDKLPEMDRRVSEDGLSLYHAISKEIEITDLQTTLSSFFGEPVKHAKEPLPDRLADNLTINYLGGIKKDQVLFLKKIGQGEQADPPPPAIREPIDRHRQQARPVADHPGAAPGRDATRRRTQRAGVPDQQRAAIGTERDRQ